MRVEAKFFLYEETELPYDLNYPLSSYIYQCIHEANPELAMWIHNVGLEYRGRSYKPFVFSRLFFDSQINQKESILVSGFVSFQVDSILPEVVHALIEGMWKIGFLTLHGNRIPLADVRVIPPVNFLKKMKYRVISPIVVPIQNERGLHYCNPLESRFYDSLRNSMKNWYYLRWKEEFPKGEEIHIRIINPEKFQLQKAAVLSKYKEKKIKGYVFPLEIEAPVKMQQVIYESGLGSYSSQGFGMVEVIEEEKV